MVSIIVEEYLFIRDDFMNISKLITCAKLISFALNWILIIALFPFMYIRFLPSTNSNFKGLRAK